MPFRIVGEPDTRTGIREHYLPISDITETHPSVTRLSRTRPDRDRIARLFSGRELDPLDFAYNHQVTEYATSAFAPKKTSVALNEPVLWMM